MSGRNLAWYVAGENLERVSNAKFDLEITDQTASQMKLDIGTRICLA